MIKLVHSQKFIILSKKKIIVVVKMVAKRSLLNYGYILTVLGVLRQTLVIKIIIRINLFFFINILNRKNKLKCDMRIFKKYLTITRYF